MIPVLQAEKADKACVVAKQEVPGPHVTAVFTRPRPCQDTSLTQESGFLAIDDL